MLALPAFRSFFSFARAVRMSLARFRASIRWSSDLSGAAAEVLTGAAHVGGEYSRGSGARKGDLRDLRRNSPRPRVEVEVARSPSRSSTLGQLARRPARPARGSRKFSVPTATSVGPGGEEFERVGAAGDPSHADHRHPDRGGDRARPAASATGRTAGPERPPRPPPSQGSPVAGSIALAFSVLISETASAPARLGGDARPRAGSATFGVSFTISGFSVSGRSASSSASVSSGCSPTISPEWTLGQETLSSIAATSSRSATAVDQPRELLGARRHHRDDQRHRQLGQLRQVLARGTPRGPCSAARSS